MGTHISADPHRPGYHFLPPSNWMNDPNGLIHWRGEYHMFYQYNPHGAFHGTIHWGHAVSRDLVRWSDRPIALAPTPDSYDQDGIFSGCMIDHHGIPTIVYTGVRGPTQRPCLATSPDDLTTWVKDPANPVITPPAEVDQYDFRDHTLWREGDTWYQGIGTSTHGVGCVPLFRSRDLRNWEYLGLLFSGDATTGSLWECPDFFTLADRHVLLLSPIPFNRVIYFSGRYRDHRLTPEVQGEVDLGGCLYAPQSFSDAHGRRIMFGWLQENRSVEAQRAAGWSGVMSLPRVLTLHPDGTLVQTPAAELTTLRGEHRRVERIAIAAGSRSVPPELHGNQIELRATFDTGRAEQCGLAICRSPDGAEETLIFYDRTAGALVIDRKQSSLSADAGHERRAAPFILEPGEPLDLRIFIDHSVLEIFANDRVAMAARIYPSRADSREIAPIAAGGHATLTACDVWELDSIWSAPRSELV
ncbi:MAG TPA: glycoside hydrolase family 32 protein [Roseiflexaceae bacterium]|nr:glycoside hydrolase family 32 protein [Roseiflexaceae bacterium]